MRMINKNQEVSPVIRRRKAIRKLKLNVQNADNNNKREIKIISSNKRHSLLLFLIKIRTLDQDSTVCTFTKFAPLILNLLFC
jgi:hypothetical protein